MERNSKTDKWINLFERALQFCNYLAHWTCALWRILLLFWNSARLFTFPILNYISRLSYIEVRSNQLLAFSVKDQSKQWKSSCFTKSMIAKSFLHSFKMYWALSQIGSIMISKDQSKQRNTSCFTKSMATYCFAQLLNVLKLVPILVLSAKAGSSPFFLSLHSVQMVPVVASGF